MTDNFDEIDKKRAIKNINQMSRLTDTSNAEKINELFGSQIRFDHRRKRWLIWQDHRWQPDTNGSINRFAISAARKRYSEAKNIENLDQRAAVSKWAIASESKAKLDAAVAIAKSLEPIADKGDNWDSDPMLLSCSNGIVDLKTGLLRNGKPEDRITMVAGTAFDSSAKSPQWEKFISEVFEENQELIQYVQKALGYTLTGSMREQVVFFGFGGGSNGKSVLFSTIKSVLGDYAYNAPGSLFQRDTRNTNSNDIAAIEFKRFLMSSEILSATKINEQRLKKWSGGDPETARYLYSEFFTFYPACKIWLFVNHKPLVEDDSYAFWRRVRLIPFNRKFEGKSKDELLTEKLKSELPGILNWLLKGCLLWQKEGLSNTPEIIKLATKEYQEENDLLSEFISENCDEGEDLQVKASLLYSAYSFWTEGRNLKGRDVLTSTQFGRRLGDKFTKKHKETGWFYNGIALKEAEI